MFIIANSPPGCAPLIERRIDISASLDFSSDVDGNGDDDEASDSDEKEMIPQDEGAQQEVAQDAYSMVK